MRVIVNKTPHLLNPPFCFAAFFASFSIYLFDFCIKFAWRERYISFIACSIRSRELGGFADIDRPATEDIKLNI